MDSPKPTIRPHEENIPPEKFLTGRLAPSPTGYMHVGNAWAFLLAWWAAKWGGGKVLLRMEDIDPERSRPEFARAIREDFAWLGLDWEEVPEQSSRVGAYTQALELLEALGYVYPCFCSRKELRALAELAHAPHGGVEAGREKAGQCRCRNRTHAEQKKLKEQGMAYTLRLYCPPEKKLEFMDAVKGPQSIDLAQAGGDFAVRRSDGVWAYQLAVVVDDAAFGVNQVVRGEDILLSTPRQLWLYELLGATPPQYAHIPLVVDAEGERLAKRHKSLTLRALREQGVQAEEMVGLIAQYAFGLGKGRYRAAEVLEILQREKKFPWDSLPKQAVSLLALSTSDRQRE